VHGIHVWLDVVYNHTGEGDATQPTWTLRGLDDRHAYLRNADGTYNDDAGCGNVIDPSNDEIRRLVLESLQRFADLGIDGFRFDLASILTRDGGRLVRMIGDWADAAGVTLVAEAWDLAQYQVGESFPDRRWMQWNDRFRDDIRGFLRAEPGMVPAVMQRIAGSPDLFAGDTWRSVNFVTAHDGLTLHDLMSVTSDRHRSWDAGPERRVQQMKNAFALLLLSTGAPMFVMGDEFARTQQGHDNPYDLDTDLNWVDWGRLPKWAELHSWVRSLISVRHAHVHERPPRFHGTAGEPDTTAESRSFAWCFDGALYVMANMWWNGIDFEVQEPGRWTVALSTAPEVELAGHVEAIRVPPRSIVVLTRESAGPDGARG
jgi:glycogen operon protein